MSTADQKPRQNSGDVTEVVVDMSAAAVEERLRTVERMRRLCASLAEAGRGLVANVGRAGTAQ